MNTFTNFSLRILFLTICLTATSFSQELFDPQGVVYNRIVPLIQGKYGQDYRFNYTMMDTVVRYSFSDNVQDPYGTLKGCVLFSAYKYQADSVPNNFIVGMIKHGRIIWDNVPGSEINLSDDNTYGTLLYSQDINNDGEVDLVFADYQLETPSASQPDLTSIRILSWNGTRGRFISGDMIGSGENELLDVNSDGTKDLRVKLLTFDETSLSEFKTSSFPYVTYGWNGTQYGLWPNVKQYAENEFLPANHFQANVKCKVEEMGNNFKFIYSVTNYRTSNQKIKWIFIEGVEDTSHYYAPPPWISGTSLIGGRSFSIGFDQARKMIKPGETQGGFITLSPALPTIVKYYLQGYTGGVTCCPTDAEESQNILTNSVSGYTLGTRDMSISVGLFQWLDTLIYYTHQSATLGWLGQGRDNDNDSDEQADNGIAKNIEQRYQKAKQELLKGDSVQARKELETLVQKVQRIWKRSQEDEERGKRERKEEIMMTSESYALLQYNTEYVINLLPEKSPRK